MLMSWWRRSFAGIRIFSHSPTKDVSPVFASFRLQATGSVNYPKQHSDNCSTKHQATKSCFKPMVRILKNARVKLANDGKIDNLAVAPSYFLEVNSCTTSRTSSSREAIRT